MKLRTEYTMTFSVVWEGWGQDVVVEEELLF